MKPVAGGNAAVSCGSGKRSYSRGLRSESSGGRGPASRHTERGPAGVTSRAALPRRSERDRSRAASFVRGAPWRHRNASRGGALPGQPDAARGAGGGAAAAAALRQGGAAARPGRESSSPPHWLRPACGGRGLGTRPAPIGGAAPLTAFPPLPWGRGRAAPADEGAAGADGVSAGPARPSVETNPRPAAARPGSSQGAPLHVPSRWPRAWEPPGKPGRGPGGERTGGRRGPRSEVAALVYCLREVFIFLN